jgi:hypothetical protein
MNIPDYGKAPAWARRVPAWPAVFMKTDSILAFHGFGSSCRAWFSLALVVWVVMPLFVTSAASPYAGDWVRLAEHGPFSPRDTAEGAVFAGKMWLSNGWLGGNKLERDLWSTADGLTWTLVSTNAPYDGYAEMVVYRGKLWAVKGSVWNSADGVNWKRVAEKTPFSARGYGEVVVHKSRMWQLGSGQDVWSSRDGERWDCATTNATYGPRFATAVACFKGKLWVMGGAMEKTNAPPEALYKQFTTFNDVWCSASGADWTRVVEHAPWSARMWFIPVVYADRLWIIGGFDNVHRANVDDVWWTEDGASWHRLETRTKFSPRHESTAYVYDNSLWVVAGNSWPLMNDIWRLTP